MSLKTSLINIHLIKVVTKSFPVEKVLCFNDEIVFIVKRSLIQEIINFLKNHSLLQFKQLVSVSGTDYPKKQKRFEISYDLLSVRYNFRVRVKVFVNELQYVNSVEKSFDSANWFECEIFDMLGVFFSNHTDLKRLLTDYGFEGYPLRKDFPLSGFVEVRYDEKNKRVVNEYLELAQEYRVFEFSSPWQ